jgi:dolichol-phosphate mannosyltransferase
MSASRPACTLVIVPTYNEAANIAALVAAILAAAPAVDILFVDDQSPDGTQEAIVRMQQQVGPQVQLLPRAGPRGLGSAYLSGFQWALAHDYQVIVQMDADLSHDPRQLPHLLARLASADVVVGSRYIPGGGTRQWSRGRSCLSRMGARYARWLLRLPLQDPTSGYTVWRRRVLEALTRTALQSEGFVFQVECKYRAYRAGFRLVETPIVFRARQHGTSKLSLRIVLEAVWRTWHLRRAMLE